ncbi:MAG: methyltransferase family protein [Candidatus Helarchaeota archaeon]
MHNINNIIVLSLFLLFAIVVLVNGIKLKSKKEEFLGKTPINKLIFLSGKISMGISWGFFIAQALSINLAFFQVNIYLSWIGTCIFIIGIIFVLSSFYYLGISSKFGLPGEKLVLVTNGIYSISRNPMYLGFFLISIASCVYCPNPLNFIFAGVGIIIHHKIVMSEESFLFQQFKEEWIKYKKKVRRYL